ncbi:MAG TPA: hypothetical protein VFL57_11300 [Bryobacteraceae bacterium]|nr:hypothetical protein [Bryobacteraceae bacterium]
MRKYLAVLALLAAAFTALGQAPAPAAESPFASIQEHIDDLSRITGLKPLRKVQCDTIGRAELRKFLEQRVREEIKPEELRIEELALKKLGLVPPDFHLAATMVDLMTEQAEAFYDYRRKKLFLVEADPTPMQQPALFHELAHALADQHFQLEKFIRRGKTDDSSLARLAVMEGQATWLMYEWMAGKAGQSLRKQPGLAHMLLSRSDSLMGQYPILGTVPLYLRASLLFPYTEGLRFQQAVVAKLGEAGFTEVFRNPPANSQQIMHPEKYFAGVTAVEPKLPAVPDAGRYREIADATVGEFDHAILLEQYGDKDTARPLAEHWRGGKIRLFEDKKDKRVVLAYASLWDSEENARKVFAGYKRVLEGKWKKVSFIQNSGSRLEGVADDGVFVTELDGRRVISVEGLPIAARSAKLN